MILPYLTILRKKNFFFLWFGQIVSQFGDKLTQIALVGLVAVIFGAPSNLAIASIFSMAILPVVILSPITGVYIDRWSKRKTMYVCDLFRGLLILLIPFFFLEAKFFPFICIVIFISSSFGRFFIPAKMSIIPQLIEKKEIFLANSLVSVTATSAAIFGIGIGGFLVDFWGIKTVFYIDAATFFISAISIFCIASKEGQRFIASDIIHIGKDVVDTVKRSFIGELKDGLRYIFNSDETRYAFRVYLFLFSYIGGIFPVYITFIQGALGTSAQDVKGVGVTSVSLGAGVFLGSLLYGRIAHRFSVRSVIDFCTFAASAFLIFFTLSIRIYPYLLYSASISLILGLLISPIFIGVNSIIHRESEKGLLGRIFSSLEFASHLGFLLAMFIFGYIADHTSSFTTMLIIGIMGGLFSLFFLCANAKNRRAKATTT